MSDFIATNNPNLTCIQVDDAAYSTTNWTNIDAAASFSTDCGYIIYTISATVNPVNSGTIVGAGDYIADVTVTLTATANTGYTFLNWEEDGTEVSTNAAYSFTATADRTLVANFVDVTGVFDVSLSKSVEVYPNPNSGQFKLDFDNDYIGNLNIKLYSVNGSVIKQLDLNKSSNKFTCNFDLDNIAAGTYYIDITTTKENFTKTVIIKQ
jgi:hypothetical protein